MGAVKTAYLLAYNAASLIGWAFLWYQLATYFGPQLAAGKSIDFSHLYAHLGNSLKLVQTAAVLEVVHSAVGLVPSPVATSFMQVFSRLGVLWGMVHVAPTAQVTPFFALTVASWSAVEVPRYAFYLAKLLLDGDGRKVDKDGAVTKVPSKVPYLLTWIRYSLFLVLYPTGITGEIGCLLASLPFVRDHRVASMSLPNPHNLALDYHWVLIAMLALYVPGSYTMYTHMLKQRAKELSPKAPEGSSGAAVRADSKKRN